MQQVGSEDDRIFLVNDNLRIWSHKELGLHKIQGYEAKHGKTVFKVHYSSSKFETATKQAL